MDYENLTPYEDLGPHRRLTSPAAARPSKEPPPKTQRLIGELGLRYPPASQADLEQHAASLALLTADVAHVNPDLLERAIEDHVRNSVYMPKAAELIALAKQFETSRGKPDLAAIAAKYNARLLGEGRRDIHWVVDGTELKLESTARFTPTQARPITATPEEIAAYGKAVNRARQRPKTNEISI